jgi:hypothetical protein
MPLLQWSNKPGVVRRMELTFRPLFWINGSLQSRRLSWMQKKHSRVFVNFQFPKMTGLPDHWPILVDIVHRSKTPLILPFSPWLALRRHFSAHMAMETTNMFWVEYGVEDVGVRWSDFDTLSALVDRTAIEIENIAVKVLSWCAHDRRRLRNSRLANSSFLPALAYYLLETRTKMTTTMED